MPVNKNSFSRYRIIDACLRNKYHTYPTREDIIEKCEEKLDCKISLSTFEKDLYAMKNNPEPGYYAPIEYSKTNKGYYYSDESYSIENFALKEEDIDAIEFATAMLQQYKKLPILEKYASAIDKIMDVVNVRKILNKDEFTEFIQLENVITYKGNEYLETIINAIKETQVLIVKYRAFYSTKETVLIIHPYLLKENKNRWYLIGLNEKYKDISTLSLDRITSVEAVTNVKYTRTSFNPDEYYKYSIGMNVIKGKPKQILLEFAKEQAQYLITQPIHESQKVVKTTDTKITISLKVHPTIELISFIQNWGNHVKVIKPIELQNKIIEEYKKCLKLYKG
ncbi:MAG: WYL domain-containing protein [Bacteroidetes bacterium]|nr:WYL domain-containing protein [Bacteroidota bacterium]